MYDRMDDAYMVGTGKEKERALMLSVDAKCIDVDCIAVGERGYV